MPRRTTTILRLVAVLLGIISDVPAPLLAADMHTITFKGLSPQDSTALIDEIKLTPQNLGPAIGDPAFEAFVDPANDFKEAPVGSGWTFTKPSGVSKNGSGYTGKNPDAPQGSQVAYLQQQGNLSQAVTNWTCASYKLEFKAAQRNNPGDPAKSFQVLIDNVKAGEFTPAGFGYQSFSLEFTVIAPIPPPATKPAVAKLLTATPNPVSGGVLLSVALPAGQVADPSTFQVERSSQPVTTAPVGTPPPPPITLATSPLKMSAAGTLVGSVFDATADIVKYTYTYKLFAKDRSGARIGGPLAPDSTTASKTPAPPAIFASSTWAFRDFQQWAKLDNDLGNWLPGVGDAFVQSDNTAPGNGKDQTDTKVVWVGQTASRPRSILSAKLTLDGSVAKPAPSATPATPVREFFTGIGFATIKAPQGFVFYGVQGGFDATGQLDPDRWKLCIAYYDDDAKKVQNHEGMRVRVRPDGRYEVRFNATAPSIPVVARLQLILYIDKSKTPRTITLPPIRMEPTGTQAFPANLEGGVDSTSYIVVAKGYSPVLQEAHIKPTDNMLLVKRIGTARVGNGVQYQASP